MIELKNNEKMDDVVFLEENDLNSNKKFNYRALAAAIIIQSIKDAFLFRNPIDPESKVMKKYDRKSKFSDPDFVSGKYDELSWDARNFLNVKNYTFCFLCESIDIDPEYLLEKIYKLLIRYDDGENIKIKDYMKLEREINSQSSFF